MIACAAVFIVGKLFAECPAGTEWESVDSDEFEIVGDAEECPDGYDEIVDPDILPNIECDAAKGTCMSMCLVPPPCSE